MFERSRPHGTWWGVVNRFPRGLLTLLDSGQEGQTPHLVPQHVQPSIHMNEFYEQGLIQRFDHSTGTMSASGAWFNGTVTVPTGEMWHVVNFGAISNALAAGTTYTIALGLNVRGSQALISTPATFTTPSSIALGWSGDVWLQPGDGLAVYVANYVAGTAVAAFFRGQYYRYTN